MANPDMLKEIFRLQADLNLRIGVDTANMPAEKRPNGFSITAARSPRKRRS